MTPIKKLTITGINPYPANDDISTYKKRHGMTSERVNEASDTNLIEEPHLKKVNIDIELIKKPPLRSETINLAH